MTKSKTQKEVGLAFKHLDLRLGNAENEKSKVG
jgi:hypothetical protein